jgi:hypothetical protein
MSFKDKIMNTITTHPKIVTFGIGLAITFVIGTAIGLVDHSSVYAATNAHGGVGSSTNFPPPHCYGCNIISQQG